MESKKALSSFEKGYLIFIGILVVALAILFGLNHQYLKNSQGSTLEDLKTQYNVVEENGDRLVQCPNGSIDVYRPKDFPIYVCGQVVSNESQ